MFNFNWVVRLKTDLCGFVTLKLLIQKILGKKDEEDFILTDFKKIRTSNKTKSGLCSSGLDLQRVRIIMVF